MDQSISAVQRWIVAIVAAACLIAGTILWLSSGDSSQRALWTAGLVRAGIVLTALWIALPTRHREAAWARLSPRTLIGGLIAIIAVVRLPFRVILPLFVILTLVGLLLRPRPKTRPSRR